MRVSRSGFRESTRTGGEQLLRWRKLLSSLFLLCSLSTSALGTEEAEQNDDLTGQLLVATAQMGDPRFSETLIYIVKHNTEGAFGLVINRPLAKGPLTDLLKSFGIADHAAKGEIILHYGGPVSPDAGFILHSDDVLL